MSTDGLPVIPDELIELIQRMSNQEQWSKLGQLSKRTYTTYQEQVKDLRVYNRITKEHFLHGEYEIIRRSSGDLPAKAMKWAYQYGGRRLIDYVLSQGWRNWPAALLGACRGGHVSLADEVYRTKINYLNSKRYFYAACKSGNIDMVKWVMQLTTDIFKREESDTAGTSQYGAYFYVYATGNPDIIALTPELDIDDFYSIIEAFAGLCRSGNRELIANFIGGLPLEFLELHDNFWAAGVREAAGQGYMDIVSCLIDNNNDWFYGANDRGLREALRITAKRGDEFAFLTISSLLRERSGEVPDPELIISAAKGGSVTIVENVMTSGNSPDNAEILGQAFYIATLNGNIDVVNVIWTDYSTAFRSTSKYIRNILVGAAQNGDIGTFSMWHRKNDPYTNHYLEAAAAAGQVRMAKYIVSKLNKDDTASAFIKAFTSYNLEMVNYFLTLPAPDRVIIRAAHAVLVQSTLVKDSEILDTILSKTGLSRQDVLRYR